MYGIILVRQVSLPGSPPGKRDWPFLGSYLLSAIFSMLILALSLTEPPPLSNTYHYIHLFIFSLRVLLFCSLLVVSEILRIRPISLPDTESDPVQPLKRNGSATYGTFDSNPVYAHGHGLRGSGSNPPPQGGWITYVKSFKVVMSLYVSDAGIFSTFMAKHRSISPGNRGFLFPYIPKLLI